VPARLIVLGLALVVFLVAAVVLRAYAPGCSPWVALVCVVAILGWVGSTPDRPLLDRAVIIAAVPTHLQHRRRGAGLDPARRHQQALARNPNAIAFPSPITRDGPGYRPRLTCPSASRSGTSRSAGNGSPPACAGPSGVCGRKGGRRSTRAGW